LMMLLLLLVLLLLLLLLLEDLLVMAMQTFRELLHARSRSGRSRCARRHHARFIPARTERVGVRVRCVV